MGIRSRLFQLPVVAVTLASACGAGPGSSSDTVEKRTQSGALVVRSRGGTVTPPSSASPRAIAAGYLAGRSGLSAEDLQLAGEVTGRNGVTHLRFQQQVSGLPVHGAYARVAVSSRGEVVQAVERLASRGPVAAASISAAQALSTAARELGYAEGDGAQYFRPPSVQRVAYVTEAGRLAEGFVVETWSLRGNQLDYSLVGGDGAVVSVERRTQNDSYNVFVEDPWKSPQGVVSGPGAGNAESPAGWLSGAQSTVNLTGNNAHAYLDTDANNAPDTGGSAVTDGNFLTAADLASQPSTAGNKNVAVQNLFYLNNVAHDVLYRHGFNEAAGNFQANNFGKGGLGTDAVLAEAQDGSGLDNANFSTPNDGSAPRMQMYLWSGSSPTGLVTVSGFDYGLFASSFGPALTSAGITGPLAIYNDGTGVATDGCEASTASLTGRVAIVDRGTCNFTVKVLNAQKAGAVGVVIVNNVYGGAFSPGGTERRIKIPSGMVSLEHGPVLKGQAGASANLRLNPVAPLRIDGDLDSDVVFHEYGHGLTWRMIGSMSGALAGAIGEGASDVNAFLIDGDDRIGEYAAGSPAGIRRYPYVGYPLTYSAVTGAEVHDDGEIYAGAMWRVLENYLAAGLSADDLHGDFVDGMNFTPAGPAFEDMRDGMLQSVAGSGRECLVWRGFAASGIGEGADGRVGRRGAVTIIESFTVPSSCP